MASTQPLDISAKRPRRAFRAIVIPDMTPMVGVGFLLVSFFLLTATLEKPTVMQVTMPVKERPDGVGYSCFGLLGGLTVILGENSKVYYYSGVYGAVQNPEIHVTDLSSAGLRQVLLTLSGKEVVYIKASDDAKYQDMVDALDEMNITNRKKYAMVDISAEEYDLVKKGRL
ncbi:ExbD/TolR family protein [Hymenobacter fodinae]|nr:biopolymer transporter ExbD [Hymenobacter fodinae]